MFRRTSKHYDEASLYEYAIGALGRRMRSVAELKRLLRQRMPADKNNAEGSENNEATVEAVIQRLKEQRYLNDS